MKIHPYYKTTFMGMAAVLAGLVIMCIWAASWSGSEADRLSKATTAATASRRMAEGAEATLGAFNKSMVPVRAFVKAWTPYVKQGEQKDLATTMRGDLESIAQTKMNLVTDQPTTPQPVDYPFGGITYSVQKVSLRASGENLNSLLTWLGEAEKGYPYARVEQVSIMAQPGGSNVSLTLTLDQPLVVKK